MPDLPYREFDSFKYDIDSKLPLRLKAWFFARRVFRRLNPIPYWREAKWFIQRGRRGWADCDTWNLDSYLTGWLPVALRYYKEYGHGCPSALCVYHDQYSFGFAKDLEPGFKQWEGILDKMIAAFEAAERMQDGMYEKELGEFGWWRPPGTSAEAWEVSVNARRAKEGELIRRDQAVFEEGMGLFVKYFHDLWD